MSPMTAVGPASATVDAPNTATLSAEPNDGGIFAPMREGLAQQPITPTRTTHCE